MKLDVPYIQQPADSHHCQAATALMVLKFFNNDITHEELLQSLDPYTIEGGMHSQGPAIFFRNQGYKTFFSHHDLEVLDSTIENLTDKDVNVLKGRLSEIKQNEEGQYRITKLELDIKYIEKGGLYSTCLPKLEDIDKHLHEEKPVILSGVRNKGLHLNPNGHRSNHSIIITGVEEDCYHVNDPSPKTSGQYTISKDRLLHAWYNSGAYMTVVWK